MNLYKLLPFDMLTWELVFHAVLSLVSTVLTFYFIRTSTLRTIPIDKIEKLKVTTVFGGNRYALQLTDGRVRRLLIPRSDTEANRLRRVLGEAGVA